MMWRLLSRELREVAVARCESGNGTQNPRGSCGESTKSRDGVVSFNGVVSFKGGASVTEFQSSPGEPTRVGEAAFIKIPRGRAAAKGGRPYAKHSEGGHGGASSSARTSDRSFLFI
jgi:hypothetical protein